jgi:hypothetical protein
VPSRLSVGWFDGEDACHTAGWRDQGCYVTLSARCGRDAKGKVNWFVDMRRYLILLCACMYYYGARKLCCCLERRAMRR